MQQLILAVPEGKIVEPEMITTGSCFVLNDLYFITYFYCRAYSCEVKYKPAPASCGQPNDEKACRTG